MDSINKVFAPAKVNLYLHIIGRRTDGYHLLDSLMIFADIGDELSFYPSDRLELEIKGENSAILREESDNLVLKAARALAAEVGIIPCANISLTKRLPIAAGLGGGSSDAAAALKGLVKLWNLNIPEEILLKISLGLGADVPVCFKQKSSFVGGIGEEITETPPLPKVGIVLVNPSIPLSTPAVFKARKAEFSSPARFKNAPVNIHEFIELLRSRNNDLMPPAIEICPEITNILTRIGENPDCRLARMSGSGATCFGLYENLESAKTAERLLKNSNPEWWSASGNLL